MRAMGMRKPWANASLGRIAEGRKHSGPCRPNSHARRETAASVLYVLGQLLGPVALFTFLLTCVIWLTQSLRLLDLVINRGQSAPTFVYLTLLILPSLLVIILPIAFFFGTLFTLSRLNADSELVVMASAGFSRASSRCRSSSPRRIVMALTYLLRALSDAGRPARA